MAFEDTKNNDAIKNKYAINNNMKLIRFKYTQFDKLEKLLCNNLGVTK